MLLLIALLLLILILYINKKVLGYTYALLNPVSLLCYLWIIVFIFHYLFYGVNAYTFTTYVWIMLGLFFTAIGFWSCNKKRIVIGKKNLSGGLNRAYDIIYLKKVTKIFTFFKIIHLVYLFYSIVIRIAGSWGFFIINNTYVRNLYLDRSTSTIEAILAFLFSANVYLGYVLIGIYTAKIIGNPVVSKRERRYAYFIIVIWVIFETLSAYITMSKMSLFVFILIFATTFFNNLESVHMQKKQFRRYLPLAVAGSFGFLILIANQRNYAANGTSVVTQVLDKFVLYLSGGVEAFGIIMSTEKSPLYMGGQTFAFITRILSRLDLFGSTISIHKDAVITSLGTTNVYTWFYDFYMDFSYIGFIIMPLFMGILAGFFYNIRKNSLALNTCTAYISMAVVFSFYTFMFEQTAYIFVMLYAVIMEKTLLKRIYLVKDYDKF